MQNLSMYVNILICELFGGGVIEKGEGWKKRGDPRGQVFPSGSVMSLEGIRNWTVQFFSSQS